MCVAFGAKKTRTLSRAIEFVLASNLWVAFRRISSVSYLGYTQADLMKN
jgi:hypothetical protein